MINRRSVKSNAGSCWKTGSSGSGNPPPGGDDRLHYGAQRPGHIVTIEDPIEFLHRDNGSLINQREVEVDRDPRTSLPPSGRSCVRIPTMILVGEMRDLETISVAVGGRNRPPRVLNFGSTFARPPKRSAHHCVFPSSGAEDTFALQLAAH